MVLNQEQIEKIADDAANKAAVKASADTANTIMEQIDAKEEAKETESTRKAGFNTLLATYPEQATMINAEMEKPKTEATAEFAIKVGQAESARLAAAKEQKGAADDPANPVNPKQGGDKDESGNILAGVLGIKVGV